MNVKNLAWLAHPMRIAFAISHHSQLADLLDYPLEGLVPTVHSLSPTTIAIPKAPPHPQSSQKPIKLASKKMQPLSRQGRTIEMKSNLDARLFEENHEIGIFRLGLALETCASLQPAKPCASNRHRKEVQHQHRSI